MTVPAGSAGIYGLPEEAEIYEREYEFWPWGQLIEFVTKWVEKKAVANACVVDYMCGTGYLLNEVAKRRPDLDCYGCSLTPAYIKYAKETYTRITVDLSDALKYRPPRNPDVIICTAGLHHLPWHVQPAFVEKVATEIDEGKIFIVGEELVRPFNNEKTRRLAVIEMSCAVLTYMNERETPSEILTTAADVLKSDLTAQEYKIDIATLTSMLNPYFNLEEQLRVWPDAEIGYGDYAFVCRKR